jgi:hypothetical protein
VGRGLQHRAQEGLHQALQGHRRAGLGLVAVEGLDALAVQDLGAPQEHGVEQSPLVAEVVVQQRAIDPGAAGDLAHGDRVEAVLGEQRFGGVQDRAAAVAAAVLRRSPPAGLRLGHIARQKFRPR